MVIINFLKVKQKKRICKNINIFNSKAFIGIIIAMGIIHKNVIEDYWNDDIIFCTPGISDIMTYSQFSYIYKYIYFTNKVNPTKYEKIQILYDEIIINSQNIYLPERALSLDECIIKYTGRCNFNVIIPQNPTRKGLKIYMFSE